MKIVPEKVFVQANVETAELLVVMEGFRLTLSRIESEALRDALNSGLTKLELVSGETRRPAIMGTIQSERPEGRRMSSTAAE